MIESAVTDLPQPDSPTMPSVLPALDREADAVDRVHHALAGEEVGAQVAHLEQRLAHVSLVLGSSASRRPSAMKLAQRIEVRDRDRRDDDDLRVAERYASRAVLRHRAPRGVRAG